VNQPRFATWTWRVVATAAVATLLFYAFFNRVVLLGLSLWVTRFDHGTIELVAFDEDGRPLDSVEFLRTWRPAMIVRDQAGSPVLGLQYGLGTPRIAVPSGQPVSLEMLWPVSGFGKVLVAADNAGQGYRVPAKATLRIELLPEFARSRFFQVKRWIDSHNEDRCASPEAAQELDSGSRLIREMERSTDARRRAMLSLDALRLVLRAGEKEVLAEARETIQSRRRGILRIRVEDNDGRPLPDVKLQVNQRRFDFLFGVYSDGYDAETIARLKAMGLNYAILFMTWNRTEPSRGIYSLDEFDRYFEPEELRENGFTLCGHALVWFANGEVPAYIQKLRGRPDDLVLATREHVRRIVTQYKDDVQIWEAINEGHPQWSRWALSDADLVRVAKASAEEIRKDAPGSAIMVEVTLPLGEDVALKYYPLIGLVSLGRIGPASSDPYQYLERLSRAGVPYDILALQIYNGAWMNIGWGVQVPAIDLFRFACVLDRYSKLGKPLQIGEIAVGSTHYTSALESWWHAKADQATQADYLEGVFTIAYGNTHVQGINWWGLYDNYRFVENGGLFDGSRRPKLAAERLTRLLERWRSSGEVVTGPGGWASFDGAAGDYQISSGAGVSRISTTGHIAEGRTTTLILRAARSRDPGSQSPPPTVR
jgi:endo-1,4-beta-xylanase